MPSGRPPRGSARRSVTHSTRPEMAEDAVVAQGPADRDRQGNLGQSVRAFHPVEVAAAQGGSGSVLHHLNPELMFGRAGVR